MDTYNDLAKLLLDVAGEQADQLELDKNRSAMDPRKADIYQVYEQACAETHQERSQWEPTSEDAMCPITSTQTDYSGKIIGKGAFGTRGYQGQNSKPQFERFSFTGNCKFCGKRGHHVDQCAREARREMDKIRAEAKKEKARMEEELRKAQAANQSSN